MPTARAADLAAVLRRAAQPDAGPTDGQLLTRFVAGRDEAAFTALVRRHGPMVWGVCRRALGHHDAEDAFQATFLVLARRAASVHPPGAVANWLFGVARRTTLKARAGSARRAARETLAARVPDLITGAGASDDLRPVLDRELGRLPARYRLAIVL